MRQRIDSVEMVPRDVGFKSLMTISYPFVATAWKTYSEGYPVRPNDFSMLKECGSPIYLRPDMFGQDRNCLGIDENKNKKGPKKPPKVKISFVLSTEVYNRYMTWVCQGRPKDEGGLCIVPNESAPAPTTADLPKKSTRRQTRKVGSQIEFIIATTEWRIQKSTAAVKNTTESVDIDEETQAKNARGKKRKMVTERVRSIAIIIISQ